MQVRSQFSAAAVHLGGTRWHPGGSQLLARRSRRWRSASREAARASRSPRGPFAATHHRLVGLQRRQADDTACWQARSPRLHACTSPG